MRKTGRRGAAGISLVDVCAAVATVGALTVLLIAAVPRWTGGVHRTVTVTSVQLLLRDVQQQAIEDGRPRCVDGGTWTVRTGRCGPHREGVTLFADGSASPGTLRVGSDTLSVDAAGRTTSRRG